MTFPIDRTPAHLRCTIVASCPSVHELEDGKLLIVGRVATHTQVEDATANVGKDEEAIVIDRSLLGDLIQAPSATDLVQAQPHPVQPQCDHPGLDVVAGKIVENPSWHSSTLTHADVDLEALGELIYRALAEAVAAERERASAAVICQAYWRYECVTPDTNTQTHQEIDAQNETYERRLLEYMCGELTEKIEPLSALQSGEMRRRLAAFRSRGDVK